MSQHVYKKVEVVGSSPSSIEDAIQSAVATAAESLDHLEWFEVKEMRGAIMDGKVAHYQVVLKLGFRLNH